MADELADGDPYGEGYIAVIRNVENISLVVF